MFELVALVFFHGVENPRRHVIAEHMTYEACVSEVVTVDDNHANIEDVYVLCIQEN